MRISSNTRRVLVHFPDFICGMVAALTRDMQMQARDSFRDSSTRMIWFQQVKRRARRGDVICQAFLVRIQDDEDYISTMRHAARAILANEEEEEDVREWGDEDESDPWLNQDTHFQSSLKLIDIFSDFRASYDAYWPHTSLYVSAYLFELGQAILAQLGEDLGKIDITTLKEKR